MYNKRKVELINERDALIMHQHNIEKKIRSLDVEISNIERNECEYSGVVFKCGGCTGSKNNGKGCDKYKLLKIREILDRIIGTGITYDEIFPETYGYSEGEIQLIKDLKKVFEEKYNG